MRSNEANRRGERPRPRTKIKRRQYFVTAVPTPAAAQRARLRGRHRLKQKVGHDVQTAAREQTRVGHPPIDVVRSMTRELQSQIGSRFKPALVVRRYIRARVSIRPHASKRGESPGGIFNV